MLSYKEKQPINCKGAGRIYSYLNNLPQGAILHCWSRERVSQVRWLLKEIGRADVTVTRGKIEQGELQ